MTEHFLFSANAVIPVFLVIALGYFLRVKGSLSQAGIDEMNRLVFNLALPIMLFRNIYIADFAAIFDPGFILWVVVSITLCFVLTWIFGEIYLRKRQNLIGAFVQGAFRCNFAIVGLTLAENILGGNITGRAALVAAFVVTAYNIQSVIILTAKNPDLKGKAFSAAMFMDIIVGICRNPSVIGIAAGVLASLSPLQLPEMAMGAINMVAAVCIPMALIAIGASIYIGEVKKYLRPALVATAIKILIAPVVFVWLSVLLGFRDENLVILFVIFANPTAILSYVMASRMNADTTLTSAIILLTTSLSVVTLTVGVYILRTLALV